MNWSCKTAVDALAPVLRLYEPVHMISRKQKACSCTSSTTGAAYAVAVCGVPKGALRTHSA